THLEHVETAYSFRSRILDYLWAGLPIVATSGDAFGALIESEGLGATVAPGDEEALEEALFGLLGDEEHAAACRRNVARVAPRFAWETILDPLLAFCRAPRRAPDLVARAGAAPALAPGGGAVGWRSLVAGARHLGEPRRVLRRAAGMMRRSLHPG
ncbi:MAG: glycosyltransferase, partial [Actinomycetota bacterium]